MSSNNNNDFKGNNTNQGSWGGIVEKVKGVWDNTTSSIAPAVEKVKEWTGMEIIDDPEYIKGRAMKMNPGQADLKNQALHELCEHNKMQSPVQIKHEHNERYEVLEKASELNKDQVELKEQMQHELVENKQETPAFDSRTGYTVVEKVKEAFGTTTTTLVGKTREVLDSEMMHDAVGKVKDVWDTTSTTFTERTGEAVEKVKEWTGMDVIDDPEYIRSRAMKMNPDQAQMKSQVQRELMEQQLELSPIHLKKGQLKDAQISRKNRMQKELCETNKAAPAFDEKLSTMDRVKEAWGTTTSVIAEKTGPTVEMVKEWSGIDRVIELSGFKQETAQNVHQIKDGAVNLNPEQAYKKTKMQKELREQNKPMSPIPIKYSSEKGKFDEKSKGSQFQKEETLTEQKIKERKLQADKTKKLEEDKLKQAAKTTEKSKFDNSNLQKQSGFASSDKPTTKLV